MLKIKHTEKPTTLLFLPCLLGTYWQRWLCYNNVTIKFSSWYERPNLVTVCQEWMWSLYKYGWIHPHQYCKKICQHLIFKLGNEYGCSFAQNQPSISVGTRTENQGVGATVDVWPIRGSPLAFLVARAMWSEFHMTLGDNVCVTQVNWRKFTLFKDV